MAKFIYFTPEEKARAQNTDLVSLLRAQGERPIRSGQESIVSPYIFGNFKNFSQQWQVFRGSARKKWVDGRGRRRPSRKTRKPLRPRRFGG